MAKYGNGDVRAIANDVVDNKNVIKKKWREKKKRN